jgi:hypothetical protein
MSIAGIVALLGAVATALVPLLDKDPNTVFSWPAFISLVVTGVLGLLGKGAQSTGGSVPTPPAK